MQRQNVVRSVKFAGCDDGFTGMAHDVMVFSGVVESIGGQNVSVQVF